jgi:hypothetical protein
LIPQVSSLCSGVNQSKSESQVLAWNLSRFSQSAYFYQDIINAHSRHPLSLAIGKQGFLIVFSLKEFAAIQIAF